MESDVMNAQKHQFCCYYRVSTQKQGLSGLGLSAQQEAVKTFVASRGGEIVAPWSDDARDVEAMGYVEVETGKRTKKWKRPQLTKALEHCEMTGATLVVAKIDRLSRNAAFLMTLRDSGVDFVAADLPDANTMTVGIMAIVAQHEAETISARTKVALAASQKRRKAARAKGKRVRLLGGFRAKAADISLYRDMGEEAAKAKAQAAAEKCRKAVEPLVQQGLTLQAIADRLNKNGILTPRSEKNRIEPSLSRSYDWHAQSVLRVIKRLKIERPAHA
jgi:DNA invertase Pin-like site-specific DNA recombinase